jgi:hypothetical protein
MGGFYVDINNQYRDIHWACRDCIVRPMCTEKCDRLSLLHWLCENCSKDIASECDDPCDKVIRSKRLEYINHMYGGVLMSEIIKHQRETSFARLLRIPEKTTWSVFKQS